MRLYLQLALGLLALNSFSTSCDSLPKKEIKLITKGKLPTIVVDLGDYQTVEAAVSAAENIDWFDRDVRDDNICTASFAAQELRDYLCQITGHPQNAVPIVDDGTPTAGLVVCVGDAPQNVTFKHFSKQINRRWKKPKSKSAEGYRIDTFGDETAEMVLLKGETRVGTLYAVYDLLEQLGIRWFGPGKKGEMVPRHKAFILPPTARYEEPAFEIRGFWIVSGQDEGGGTGGEGKSFDRGNPAFYEWMGRNRLNYFWNKEEHWTDLKLRGVQLNCGGQNFYLQLLKPDRAYPYNHPNFLGDEDKPDDPYAVGSEYVGDVDSNAVLTYSEAHPEWYGMDEQGKRFFPADIRGINFCTSNEDGIQEFCKNIVIELKNGNWYNADVYDFWPLAVGAWCQCENCRALGNDTDRIFYLLYKIRKAIRTAYQRGELGRDVKVFTSAIQQTWAPPTKQLPKDFDYESTAIVFFPQHRCYDHSFEDSTCTEANTPIRKHLESWFDKKNPYRGKIYIGEYYNSSAYRDLPLVLTRVLADDIPYYHSLGIKGIHYMHTATTDLGLRTVLNYQFAKQLWNPLTDIPTLMNDFFTKYYAGVAADMVHFYVLIEQALANVEAWRYELRERMIDITVDEIDQPLLPLQKFREHFHLEEQSSPQNDGVDWERTYQLIHEARFLLDEIVKKQVSDVVLDRLIEDEHHFRYGELTVHLYDDVLRLLTLGEDEPEMREEALGRLRHDVRALSNTEVPSPALGVSNALEATGLKDVVNFFLRQEGI